MQTRGGPSVMQAQGVHNANTGAPSVMQTQGVHQPCKQRINPIFSTVLSQNSKLLVIAQLHSRSTEHLMSNIHLHNTIQHAFAALMQVQTSPVHSNLESHILYTPPPTTTTTMNHLCCSNGNQAGFHHVSFWLRTSEKDVLD